MTNLTEAAESGNVHQVKSLLNKVSIDEVDHYGDSALLHAAWSCNIEIANLLLENGADIDLEDEDGETPIFSVVQNTKTSVKKKYEMLALLLKHDPDCSHKNGNERNIMQVIEEQGGLNILHCLFDVEPIYNNNLTMWGKITPHLASYN